MVAVTGTLIAAGIGAAGAIGGGILASKGAKSAANTAAASNAENNALQREVYGQNTQNLKPFMQRGNAAGDTYNALLGLPGAQDNGAGNTGGDTDWAAYARGEPDALNWWNVHDQFEPQFGGDIAKYGQFHWSNDQKLGNQARDLTPYKIAPQTALNGSTAMTGANNAFRQYIDNSDYAFRQNEGDKGLNAGYAAKGLLESGAAMKALERYRGNLQAGYRNEYMGHLGNQQGVGLSGANALAGVGTNYANAVGANNQANASVQANAALAGSNALGSGLAGAGAAIGNAFAPRFGSSYGGFNVGQATQGFNAALASAPRFTA